MSRTAACLIVVALLVSGCSIAPKTWRTLETSGDAVARHEATFVAHDDKLYLIGGRGIKPVTVFDPATREWTTKATPPLEIHHVQAVSLGDAIYLIGAMTGGYPDEKPIGRVLRYLPAEDRFEWTHDIPTHRQRGGAAAVVHGDAIYLVGGITNGHRSGSRAWLDRYSPSTGAWQALADAPDARDHAQAAVIDDALWVAGGRRTSLDTGEVLSLTTRHLNRYDFRTGEWQVSSAMAPPTLRAGNSVIGWRHWLIVGGGESATQQLAHHEIEAYDTIHHRWYRWPDLNLGRHGSGFAIVDDVLYTAAGSGEKGGAPELADVETLALPANGMPLTTDPIAAHQIVQRLHTVTRGIEGPTVDETDVVNPFTDYRLDAVFENGNRSYRARGFFAADGDAADSSATSGNRWHVRFRPEGTGLWTYRLTLVRGKNAALDAISVGETVAETSGTFEVIASDKAAPDWRANGPLEIRDGRFVVDGRRWLKMGNNSPENLLAFTGFDGTFQRTAESRDGEARRAETLHRFDAHRRDWLDGDRLWRDGQAGHALIGAINYLADVGVRSTYFLTMNIEGDGDDVWPYLSPDQRDRFDVSKLEQWERLFVHMQSKGIALHVVLQETENERLLDDGDVGRLRQLYLLELIARFAHHNGLVWNIGEENGPADFSPNGQSTPQRQAMLAFLAENDPYDHPRLIHSHADREGQERILMPLLGFGALDGVSLQVNDPSRVNGDTRHWKTLAAAHGHPWVVSVDEVGPWYTGAVPDDGGDTHANLRAHALWGGLLAGADGVEWYFGAQHPHNDLTAEDFRQRASLWQQSKRAHDLMTSLGANDSEPCSSELTEAYCLTLENGWLIYVPAGRTATLTTKDSSVRYSFRSHALTTVSQSTWRELALGGDNALRIASTSCDEAAPCDRLVEIRATNPEDVSQPQ
ncbi:MAG: DUF5060 domain-containing protein [Pseudomonadota bacterium]